MSEEDAFLAAIAADRADRTRLLVFADWLADHSDPREDFIRLHARLLDMVGTESEFANLETEWVKWTGGVALIPGYLPGPTRPYRLNNRWLDALCRVFTSTDLAALLANPPSNTAARVEWQVFDPADHINASCEETLVLYRGKPGAFAGPLDFAARTVLYDLWDDPFHATTLPEANGGFLSPVTRGSFWQRWRMHCAGLLQPPPLPRIASDNWFLGGQYIEGDWNNWAFIAEHRHDYFALFWSTTA